MAFTYGLKADPLVAAEFLKKLTLQSRHAHIAPHTSSLKPAKNLILLKVGTDAFSPMYPSHKKLPEERISITDPALGHVTVGYVITRFRCQVLVRMNRLAVAETLLLSHQFSFGIKGGVQQVIILGITLSLKLNPNFVEIYLDLKNAHTFSSRDKAEEELESDEIFN